ncbi:MAG: acylphosphatase [Jatrophihabitantaceae bacterium]
MDEARLSVWVRGRVQGVWFRYWTRSAAQDLGLRGSAVNLPDGRVAIVVEGPRERCAALLDALASDRPPGWVGEITHSWGVPTGEPDGFRVR